MRDRFRTGTLVVRHAHGYVPQTLADLGWAGLALSLLALLAWGVTAARVIGLRRRDRGLAWDAERVGMATLVAVAVVFGVHSALDWTWFVPANALGGIIAAAWVVARPPLRERLAAEALTPALPAQAPRPVAVAGLWGPAVVSEPVAPAAADIAGPGRDRRRRRRLAQAAAVPVGRGDRGRARAGALAGRRLVGAPARALGARRRRRDRAARARASSTRPSPSPRSPTSATRSRPSRSGSSPTSRSSAAGSPTRSARYEQAVQIQPATAETWRRLGRFQLSALNQPAQAVQSFQAAYFLDPRNPASQSDFLEATRAAGQAGVTP